MELSSTCCCSIAACPKSGVCYRHLNYQKQMADADFFEVLNPSRQAPDANGCQHYIVETTECWAYGFKRLYATIPTGNAKCISWSVYFGSESTYYRTKRGERPLTPIEQQKILDTVARLGGNPSVGFDRYADQKVYRKPEHP